MGLFFLVVRCRLGLASIWAYGCRMQRLWCGASTRLQQQPGNGAPGLRAAEQQQRINQLPVGSQSPNSIPMSETEIPDPHQPLERIAQMKSIAEKRPGCSSRWVCSRLLTGAAATWLPDWRLFGAGGAGVTEGSGPLPVSAILRLQLAVSGRIVGAFGI